MKTFSDKELMDAAVRCAKVHVKIANEKCGSDIKSIAVEFDLQDRTPKAAGEAARNVELISINMILYRDNIQVFLNEVIPHEMAHLIQFNKFDTKGFPTKGHGVEWQEAMRKIGQKPVKYHNLDVTKALIHYKNLKKKKKVIKTERDDD